MVLKKYKVFLQEITEPFIVKINYKNLTGFLTIKELSKRQVYQVAILLKYYFKIKYTKGSNNI